MASQQILLSSSWARKGLGTLLFQLRFTAPSLQPETIDIIPEAHTYCDSQAAPEDWQHYRTRVSSTEFTCFLLVTSQGGQVAHPFHEISLK